MLKAEMSKMGTKHCIWLEKSLSTLSPLLGPLLALLDAIAAR
jgi:hypothetical protein